MVGGMMPVWMVSAVASASMAPAAPNRWPTIDLIEETASRYAWAPNTSLIASVSAESVYGEDGVGLAAADHLGRVADGMGAAGAGRHDGVVHPARSEQGCHVTGGRVDQHVRQPVRRDALTAALLQHVLLVDDLGQAAHGAA